MIIKEQTKSMPLRRLEAALPRLRSTFPRIQEIQKEIAILYRGYIGEQKVNYHLRKLPSDYIILHDVYLKANGLSFQMDTLIISSRAIYIIESKNYRGKITFNTIFRQFTRDDGETETGYTYPITQAENQKLQLSNWLHQRNIHVPVHYFIAISEPSTIINVIGDAVAIAEVVAHADYIPKKITDFDAKLKATNDRKWTPHKIGHAILRECHEYDYDILTKFGIRIGDIVTGVQCLDCGKLGMKRNRRKWHCLKCNSTSKYAHQRALKDYLLLINPYITNKECMIFLKVTSRHIISRLLRNANFRYHRHKRIWTPH